MNELENRRLDIQLKAYANKTVDERRAFGQFDTPYPLAAEIVSYALTLFQSDELIDFLEPAFGTGSFYSALVHHVSADRIRSAFGYEIDDEIFKAANTLWGDSITLFNKDFTDISLPENLANLVITNPPYVRHQLIPRQMKEKLSRQVASDLHLKVSGLAGLYCYFILLSHKFLKPGAIAGWLIPSEFMDVNYGSVIKDYLLNHVTLLHIHRYDPSFTKFDDALVSSSVVWFRNIPSIEDYSIKISFGGTLQKPDKEIVMNRSQLIQERKWTLFPQMTERHIRKGDQKFSDWFYVKRGVATGANEFFILSKARIQELDLPSEFFTPILPSPRYLKIMEVLADDKGFPLIDEQLFLLKCPLSEVELQLNYPNLYHYLQSGKPEISNRYLCRHRDFWYQQEEREPAPFLCTYMGRGNTPNSKNTFRFILNHSRAIANNSFLMVYPKPTLISIITKHPNKVVDVWKFLNSIPSLQIENEGRVYGGGLKKIEPKELGNVVINGIDRVLFS